MNKTRNTFGTDAAATPSTTATLHARRTTLAPDFTFKGLSRFIAPLLKPAFEHLGDQAEAGIRKAVNQLRQAEPNPEDSFDS